MTEPKFTPPTWTVYERWNGQLEIHGNERVVGDDEICDVVAENVLERDANLIAAAPELFEALQNFVNHGSCFDEQDMQQARAAIAKARGET